jgi:GntR family transcriptional repressor for pyruvate dehydrogenase complex
VITLLQPTKSTTVVQKVIDRITDSLIKGELKPGDRLPPEPDLALQFGVSRASLREALKTLCGLGVLVARKRGGTFVAAAGSQLMLDPLIFNLIIENGSRDHLFELRVLLEVDAVELLIKKATPDDLLILAQDLEQFAALLSDGDLEALARLDYQFHLRLIQMAKNPYFNRISQVVMQLYADPIEKALRQMGPDQVLASHRELYQAIVAGDLLKAKDHILKAFESFRRNL